VDKEIVKRILSSIILIPVILLIIIKGSIFFHLFLVICFFIISFEWYKISKKKVYFYLGIIFLIYSFYTIYNLYYHKDSYLNLLFVLLICVSTDIGGYIFGKFFKGPKLTEISPNKTFSGSIGSYLTSFISTYFFLNILNNAGFDLFISEFIIYVFLISTVSQIGDILISYFKRLSNIKNTGKIIPGHGGILDRVDGMIFAFPFAYLLLSMNIVNFIK